MRGLIIAVTDLYLHVYLPPPAHTDVPPRPGPLPAQTAPATQYDNTEIFIFMKFLKVIVRP